MLSNPGDLLLEMDLTTLWISLKCERTCRYAKRCLAIWIFLSVWLTGIFWRFTKKGREVLQPVCFTFFWFALAGLSSYCALVVSKPLRAFFTRALSRGCISHYPYRGGCRVLPLPWTASVCCIWFPCHLNSDIASKRLFILTVKVSFISAFDVTDFQSIAFMGFGVGFFEAQSWSA